MFHWLRRHPECGNPCRHCETVCPVGAIKQSGEINIGEIAFQNKAAVYAILLRTAAETLATIAADPRHLGAIRGLTPCAPAGCVSAGAIIPQ